MKDGKAKIFLVDDHPLFREGVANLINRLPDLRVCGEAETAAEALRTIVKTKPNVAVVDLSLKEGSGLELIKEIRKVSPSTAIIVLSMHDERRYAERSVRAGARGYVMKIESANHVIAAIREVLGGKLYLSQKMRAEFVERFVDDAPAQSESPADLLSNRELEVFQLLGQGYETRRVAEKMGVSIKTVQAFCAKIKGKLHLANASELLHEAVRWSENQATP